MRHRDNHGGEGVIEAGGVQWMTAGRGLVHSEMPEQTEGLMRGFQLWVNLPARLKMMPAGLSGTRRRQLPVEERARWRAVKVIAGETSPERADRSPPRRPQPHLFRRRASGGAENLSSPWRPDRAAFIVAHEGRVDGRRRRRLKPSALAELGEGDTCGCGP